MKYIKLTDRLGNHLFQFSAIYCLDDEVTIVVEDPEVYNDIQYYAGIFFKNVPIRFEDPQNALIYEEEEFSYGALPSDGDIYFKGYFQSHKYLNREKILKKFLIPEEIKTKIYNTYGPDIHEHVCMHVRRGDYIQLASKHPPCSVNYYKSAIKLFADRKIVIISDDLKWCTRHFQGENIIFHEGSSYIEDFFLQSMCYSNIISNSSFSWWGAYLNTNNEKIVITPETWFGTAVNYRATDLILENWIKLSYKYTLGERLFFANHRIKNIVKSRINRIKNIFSCV